LLLDRIENDIDQLCLMNDVLRTGEIEFAGFPPKRLNRHVEEIGHPPMRKVANCFISVRGSGEIVGEVRGARGERARPSGSRVRDA
jgi:hypothetical protein